MLSKVWMDCARSKTVVSNGPNAWLLDDGTRLHLQHGPIDLLIEAIGSKAQVRLAYEQAVTAFNTVLNTLADQLPVLRSQFVMQRYTDFNGDVAVRMRNAVIPFLKLPLTPMIAVAGAVADYILECLTKERELTRAQVNNGGDIALYLAPGSQVRIGICSNLSQSSVPRDVITLNSNDSVRGIATSGWQGRSFSLGVADAVTVLSDCAASADCAATLIANAVDVPGSEKVTRVPANTLLPDTDLEGQLVTTDVQMLDPSERAIALQAGMRQAQIYIDKGNIRCAYLHLQGDTHVVYSKCLLSQHAKGCHS